MASTAASTSLSARSTGVGTSIDFLTAKSLVSMVMVAKGTCTGGLVAVQASHDNTNWVTLHVFQPETGVNRSFDLTRGAYRYYRANVLSDVTGGGSVDATFMEGGTDVDEGRILDKPDALEAKTTDVLVGLARVEEQIKDLPDLKQRATALERWRWTAMGALGTAATSLGAQVYGAVKGVT